jgi:hypothetical protein
MRWRPKLLRANTKLFVSERSVIPVALFIRVNSTSHPIKRYREIAALITSFGERKPRDLRARSFSDRSTRATSTRVIHREACALWKEIPDNAIRVLARPEITLVTSPSLLCRSGAKVRAKGSISKIQRYRCYSFILLGTPLNSIS